MSFLSTHAIPLVSISRARAPPSPSRTRVLVVSKPPSPSRTLSLVVSKSSSQSVAIGGSNGIGIGGGGRNGGVEGGNSSAPNRDADDSTKNKGKKVKAKAPRWFRMLKYSAWRSIKYIMVAWHSKTPIWRFVKATALIGLSLFFFWHSDQKQEEMAKRMKSFLDLLETASKLIKILADM